MKTPKEKLNEDLKALDRKEGESAEEYLERSQKELSVFMDDYKKLNKINNTKE